MKETFEEKLARVAGSIRRIVIDDPHRRYRDGILYWLNKADALHDAAMVLGGDPFGHHFEAFALLAGFSLEALIKGTLTGLGEKVPFTHDLVTLFERAGLELSDDDRVVLKALTVYTTWHSRYPAAKDAKGMIEGMEVLRSQYPSSGNLQTIAETANASPASLNTASYERLYGFCRQRFFDVQSSVHESVHYSYES
ncbi:HEPN domain-containing protein [Hyphomicrobium sp. D-2]|uniref:HEPN domain-containing protein n=1 Tax=Hyphomicrobium sp. D-2 TaxID=3041621 RepID=UPI002457B3C5|nr:HEPN domain-containing protein [Hyphomicrobium sp. D-2]MDH4982166.1 HEPN domain-containing protein [Hyphomicrobium sp. D-2]